MPSQSCSETGAQHLPWCGTWNPNQLPRPHQLQWARPHPSGVCPPLGGLPTPASLPGLGRCSGAGAQEFTPSQHSCSPDGWARLGTADSSAAPHRPAPAHLGAGRSEFSPGCHCPCTVWPRPPGVATSPGVQDWCIARNLILCVPGPRAPPCHFVTLRPCHRVRERSLCGPHPEAV